MCASLLQAAHSTHVQHLELELQDRQEQIVLAAKDLKEVQARLQDALQAGGQQAGHATGACRKLGATLQVTRFRLYTSGEHTSKAWNLSPALLLM